MMRRCTNRGDAADRARHARISGRPRAAGVLSVLSVLSPLSLAGCRDLWGYGSYIVAGDERKVPVEAKYRGLENRTLAVVVVASPRIERMYPGATDAVTEAASQRLARTITGVKVVNAKEVTDYQNANPYWSTLPYSDLTRQLQVQRVVYLDLAEYRTHEPGNTDLVRGIIVSNVGIIESDGQDSDNFAFYDRLSVEYPEDKKEGVTHMTTRTVELGLLSSFSDKLSNLFNDHTIIQKK